MAAPALEPIQSSHSVVGLSVLLFVDEVSCLYEQMDVNCAKSPSLQWDQRVGLREKARGEIKKTRGRGDFKVAKCAGLCLNDGWRIVLISVPRGEHARQRVTLPSHLLRQEPGAGERQKSCCNYGTGASRAAERLLRAHTAAQTRKSPDELIT